MKKNKYKSGFVALLGKPNVGKSTLLNSFLRETLAIISHKPQTTRDAIRGILTSDEHQVIFVDTPGVHIPKTKLGENMVRLASEASQDADVIIVLVDAKTGINSEDKEIFRLLNNKDIDNKVVMVFISKVDLITKEEVLPIISCCRRELNAVNIAEFIPISSISGENLDIALEKIIEYLPEGPQYYPEDELTDRNERYIISELIREQVLEQYQEEIPHSVAVLVEDMKDSEGRKTYIEATIFVERESQKGIIVGSGGNMLKKIGSFSRAEVEKLLGRPIFLKLWVKVQKNWRKDEAFLKRMGYGLS